MSQLPSYVWRVCYLGQTDLSAGRNAPRPPPPACAVCPGTQDGSLREPKAEAHKASLSATLSCPATPPCGARCAQAWKPFSSKGLSCSNKREDSFVTAFTVSIQSTKVPPKISLLVILLSRISLPIPRVAIYLADIFLTLISYTLWITSEQTPDEWSLKSLMKVLLLSSFKKLKELKCYYILSRMYD